MFLDLPERKEYFEWNAEEESWEPLLYSFVVGNVIETRAHLETPFVKKNQSKIEPK